MYWWYCFIIMVAIFCLWSFIEMKRLQRRDDRIEEKFWERERMANSVRRKPIDHLDYIHLPNDFPTDLMQENIEIADIIKTIDTLREAKILNLTGYSNTDLKIKYGAPNLTELSTYDQNYTLLITTLQKWADLLIDGGHEAEAIKLMEYMVSTKADIGKTYRLLAKYYISNSLNDKFEALVKTASELRSMNAPYITKSLKEIKSGEL